MYALLRILLVNTVWRLTQARNERIEDAQIRARVAASFEDKPLPPPKTCPSCGCFCSHRARFCMNCMHEFV